MAAAAHMDGLLHKFHIRKAFKCSVARQKLQLVSQCCVVTDAVGKGKVLLSMLKPKETCCQRSVQGDLQQFKSQGAHPIVCGLFVVHLQEVKVHLAQVQSIRDQLFLGKGSIGGILVYQFNSATFELSTC